MAKCALRPNENPEYMAQLKAEHPSWNVRQWVDEAAYISACHVSDDCVRISNLLYLALDAMKVYKKRARKGYRKHLTARA
jgi:hypothetical protein